MVKYKFTTFQHWDPSLTLTLYYRKALRVLHCTKKLYLYMCVCFMVYLTELSLIEIARLSRVFLVPNMLCTFCPFLCRHGHTHTDKRIRHSKTNGAQRWEKHAQREREGKRKELQRKREKERKERSAHREKKREKEGTERRAKMEGRKKENKNKGTKNMEEDIWEEDKTHKERCKSNFVWTYFPWYWLAKLTFLLQLKWMPLLCTIWIYIHKCLSYMYMYLQCTK